MRKRLLLSLCLVCSALRLCGAATERPVYDRTFFEPTEQVVSPHIKWAKPWAGGPVRALFITHRNAMREVVEIAQRLDMKYTVFAAEAPNKFGETGKGVDASWKLIKGNSAEELTVELLEKLKADYDVIVVANFQWGLLPIEARYEILKKVKEGTGLAGVIPGRDEYISRLLPERELHWRWGLWSGGVKDIPDYFGKGDFAGDVDYAERHTGESSLRVTGTEVVMGSREPPRGGYHQTGIPVERNTRYRFSVWYKTRGLPAGTTISLHPLGGLALPATAEWKQASTVVDTKDQDKFSVYLLNYGVGDVWFDDLSLTKEGEDAGNLLKNPGLELPPGAGSEPFLTRGMAFQSLPAFRKLKNSGELADQILQTGTFGKGRMCALNGVNPPATQGLTPGLMSGPLTVSPLEYDYYLLLPIRALLWAARKEPPVNILAPDPPLIVVDRAAGGEVRFALTAEKPQQALSVEMVLRNDENQTLDRKRSKLDLAGKSEAVYNLPRVPAGDYFVDLWLRRGEATVNWASAGVKVTSSARIDSVRLAAESFSQRQPVTGAVKVAVESPIAGAARLRLRQYDNHRRLVAEKTLPVSIAELTPFEISTSPCLTVLQKLEATLFVGEEAVDVAEVPFSINDLYPPKDDVRWVMWDSMAGSSYVGQTIAREFRKAGLDTQYTGLSEWAIRENLWHLPYATRFTDRKTDWYQEKPSRTKDDLVRDPCCTDPAYRKEVHDGLVQTAQKLTRFSTAEFSLGDENLFVSGDYDLCMSPTCLADFKQWARKDYGSDLAALNKEYGTNFTSWDDVRPVTLDEARKTGNYAAWVDHRRHMESVWAGLHQFARESIREVVPQARVGYEGSDTHAGSFHAADYWKIMRAMDLNNLYYRDFQGAAIRDFADPGTLYGSGWYGGYYGNRNEEFMRWYPWMTLFQGTNSYWVWNGTGSAGSVMAFDMSLYPFFTANAEEMREIKDGVGRLLMNAENQHDGVAVYWSSSSVHAQTFTPNMPAIDDALNSTVRLLEDMNLRPRVVSYAQVVADPASLDPRTVKALFLVETQAISDAEVNALRRYVENGGVLIADLRPGVRNQHGSVRATGALDEVFGVTQSADKPQLGRGTVKWSPAASASAQPELPETIADAGLQLAGGTVLATVGAAPAIVSHSVGKGKGILLNMSWADYSRRERSADSKEEDFAFWPVNAPYRQWASALLAESGVTPRVQLTPSLPRVQVARFRSGDLEYVGILQVLPRSGEIYSYNKVDLPPPAGVAIDFGRVSHLYDVRDGKYLGNTGKVTVPLQSGKARLYALLPYQLSNVTISAPPSSSDRQICLSLTVNPKSGKAGRHVLRLRMLGPDGKERDAYRRTVIAENGKATVDWSLALNDPRGSWTVIAQDVATGVSGKATIKVASKPVGEDWTKEGL
ncbi:MAG: hypothetical protein AUJ92_00470 [Armatimonadetes bacterium CG2_30_59_28]|nr:hypothetical protein [Armatimonadota bacterium]OIO98941.1 MAG: hypothetical protein AUJ92_00470 [Armatimonadetes bacterium CG2_30_59_28]